MSPTHHRYVFIGFALLIAGVAANVMVLQPEQPVARAGVGGWSETKSELERRQRLALERQPGPGPGLASAQASASTVAKPLSVLPGIPSFEVTKGDAARSPVVSPSTEPTAPPRVTAGGVPSRGTQAVAAQPAMEQGARRFARLRPDAAHTNSPGDRLPDAPDAEGDPDTIRAVQRELGFRGYGQLNIDGVPGLVTRAAIMAFESDNRMALTGEATEKVLSRLLLGPVGSANAVADPAAGLVRSPQAELVIRTVQQSLAALGYQVGRIDGKPGDDIARAIREFELDEGLKPTGRVSAEVFSRLGRVVASAKPKPIQ